MRPREDEIRSYEEVMIAAGAALVEARARLVALLAPRAGSAQREVSGKEESLVIDYRPAGGADLRSALEQARERE